MNSSAIRLLLTGLLALTAGVEAQAASCPQGKAYYSDGAGNYDLAFETTDSQSSASTHRFKITIRQNAVALDGYIMASEPVNRSNGMLFYNCPEGDLTGDDLAACTVWEGQIYANAGGKIDLLPTAGADAAPEILLAGFGPALQASSLWSAKKATVVPWDVFVLKGCH